MNMKKIILLLACGLFCTAAFAQEPVTFTAQQDHQNMMDQLGIKSIRRGFDADEKSPYAANYDESKANPFPVIPEILRTKAGKKVTTESARSAPGPRGLRRLRSRPRRPTGGRGGNPPRTFFQNCREAARGAPDGGGCGD